MTFFTNNDRIIVSMKFDEAFFATKKVTIQNKMIYSHVEVHKSWKLACDIT